MPRSSLSAENPATTDARAGHGKREGILPTVASTHAVDLGSAAELAGHDYERDAIFDRDSTCNDQAYASGVFNYSLKLADSGRQVRLVMLAPPCYWG
jgi:hypothetical protein